MNIFKDVNFKEATLAAVGALLCISFIAYIDNADGKNASLLIPPFGATMVLVMAVHQSPLAQPKNIFFGHTLSALSGVIIYMILGISFISVGVAVALSIWVMMITKTVHPPAGAMPILAIYQAKNLSFVLIPVALGAVIIIIFAMTYNKILKRDYPTK